MPRVPGVIKILSPTTHANIYQTKIHVSLSQEDVTEVSVTTKANMR